MVSAMNTVDLSVLLMGKETLVLPKNARWYEATARMASEESGARPEASPHFATPRSCVRVSMASCNLVGKDLSNLDLTGAFIHDADLSYADLQGTTLVNSTLQHVEFTEAKVQNADFEDSTVNGGNLQLAIFCNTVMPAGNIASGIPATAPSQTDLKAPQRPTSSAAS